MYFVYIVRCADSTLYTGLARDPHKRLHVHNSGKGAKYTRSRLPVALVYVEECESLSAALKRERELKPWSRARKALGAQAGAKIAHDRIDHRLIPSPTGCLILHLSPFHERRHRRTAPSSGKPDFTGACPCTYCGGSGRRCCGGGSVFGPPGR